MKIDETPDCDAEGGLARFQALRFEDYPEWLQREVEEFEAAERRRRIRWLMKAALLLALAVSAWLAVLWGTAAYMRGDW